MKWQLIAQGPEPRQRWKQRLDEGRTYSVGRGTACDFPVTWEQMLSRHHFSLGVQGEAVTLNIPERKRNPVFYRGDAMKPGTHLAPDKFVVGKTTFYLSHLSATAPSSASEAPFQELTFTQQDLQKVQFADADRRLEALARLPEVIGESPTREETASKLVSLILAGIAYAEAAAVVSWSVDEQVTVHVWERRNETEGTFRPSSRLIKETLAGKRSVLHVWEKSSNGGDRYTMAAEFDWAFCVPVKMSDRHQWGIYVAGQLDSPFLEGSQIRQNIQSDVRFAQLVAAVISSSQRMNRLEGQLSVLRRFLSPPILTALEETGQHQELNIDLLKPRECDVTVLFCDLRGFSQRAEGSADNLTALLDRVSAALEVISREILDHGGVTGDFLGDAVLGFWGWPFHSDDSPLKACRAALSIRREFARINRDPEHPLQDFQMGIGMAHGRAVAGQIGTTGRMAVTVFGPVVNLASRLEGMTKKLRVPIVMDEVTMRLARAGLAPAEGRIRSLGKVLPYGMATPLMVSELLPPAGEWSELSDAQIAMYEQGVEAFTQGKWEEAYRQLHGMPSSDQAQDFLLALIAQNNRRSPSNWRGVIELPSK